MKLPMSTSSRCRVKFYQSLYSAHGNFFATPGSPGTWLVLKITVFLQEPFISIVNARVSHNCVLGEGWQNMHREYF